LSKKYSEIATRVADSIKTCREKSGLTQDQVGELLEIGAEAVSRIERGISVPTLTRLAELADVFQCPIEDLLGSSSNRSADQAEYISKLISALPTDDRTMVVDVVERICERLTFRNQC
jgi:transcriptional regulator with XRE-family HTH domain